MLNKINFKLLGEAALLGILAEVVAVAISWDMNTVLDDPARFFGAMGARLIVAVGLRVKTNLASQGVE